MKVNLRRFSAQLALLFVLVALSVITVSAAPLNQAADLDQCRNGTIATHVKCADSTGGWVNGNAGAQNSHYREGDFLPYRMRLTGLVNSGPTQHTLVIGYDFINSGKHAIDYLGTYNATEADADPCDAFPCSGSPSTSPIPVDPVLPTCSTPVFPNGGIVQAPGVFTIWNGTIDTVSYLNAPPCQSTASEEVRVQIKFTTSSANVLIAWSGHIARSSDWGAGESAGGISGSPYHMRLKDLDGSGGNQDRSLSAAAIAFVNFSTQTTTPAFGGTATDTATFTFGNGGALTGSLQFYLCSNLNSYTLPVCTAGTAMGSPIAVNQNKDGTYSYNSPGFVANQTGAYCWRAVFTSTNAQYSSFDHTNQYTSATAPSNATPECFIVSNPTAVSLSSFQGGADSSNLMALFGGGLALAAGTLYLIWRRKAS